MFIDVYIRLKHVIAVYRCLFLWVVVCRHTNQGSCPLPRWDTQPILKISHKH